MIKLKNYLFLILISVTIFSCTTEKDIEIGFLIPASVGYRWIIDQGYVENAAKLKGVVVHTRSAENDENLQLKQASELLEMGVDVLIVVPANGVTAAAIVRDAHNYNVPVIGYDRLIKNSDLDYLVTFDGTSIGRLMIEHAIEVVPEGNYVLLWGDASDVNAISIKDEQERILKPHLESGKINIVYKAFVEDWSKENAKQIMKRVLTFTDQKIDAVITSYDGLALGANEALNEIGGKPFTVLTGQDAELDAINAIIDGDMSLTVYKSIRRIADAAVELAIQLARNEKIEESKVTINNGRKDVPLKLLLPVAVDKTSIRSTVIADGFYTEEEIFGE
ncbi:MAG: substrate-binding domain-containing protein [Prolixibacteraceae bacterium]|jgi:D-xylose transport system substrate-binding protein|nr:substrate-binding domain-containing protein [Prolixibacteraceae bacterium]